VPVLSKSHATWQLQEAKAKFSEVIKRTSNEPQIITVRGKDVAVILSLESYKKLVSPKPNLYDFIHNSPLRSSEADVVFDFIEKDKQFFEDKDIDL
jgi:prevent-host-death family protein